MEEPDRNPKPFRFSDPREQRIYEELKELVGPGPAAFFRDACWMMDNPHQLLTTAHLIAHCLREVEEQIRFLFQPLNCRGSRNEQINSIVILTDLPQEKKEQLCLRWKRVVDDLPHFAHKRGVHAIRPVKELQDLWDQWLSLLDVVLKAIRDNYLKWFSLLDELIKQSKHSVPTEDNLKYLTHHVPWSLATANYFFDRLENPEWLKPLWEKGFFRHPPAPIKDEKGNIRFLPWSELHPWPEARYLARMAHHKPKLVAVIIQEMDDTDNAVVLADLVDALLAMPPDVSAGLVEKVKRWAERPYELLPEKLGELIAHWAKSGHTGEALQVARVLLEVLPDERQEEPGDTGVYLLPPQPRARFGVWEYEEILKERYPELVRAIGLPALEPLCDLLDKAIRLSKRRDDDQGPEDYSYIWRPAIEDSSQNLGHTIKDALVSAVRDAAELVVSSGLATLEETVNLLESKPWKVFRRIALHLIRVFCWQAATLAAKRLTNLSLFDDVGLLHEYVLLLRECFPRLTTEEQAQILGWIENGPEVDQWKQWHQSETGRQPTEEDEVRYREIWQRDWLARIELDNLPEEWKERYWNLCQNYGEPDHPEFPVYKGEGWVGPTSPKSADELKAMSIQEIVDFLQNWTPPKTFLGEPSPEGLGRVLSSVVAEDPGRFAAEAPKFKGLDPTYVRAVVSGLKDALKQGRTFDWEPVLELCEWVLSQPLEIPGRRVRPIEADPDWGWTRKAIADLLSAGFEDGPGAIPIGLRKRVWATLKPLTEDPDPTQEREQRYINSVMGPASLGINSTRGAAMHAVIGYALWVRRHQEKEPNAEQRLQKGFAEMPEVREVLEAHLDLAREPSLAIRAVYGQRFRCLVLLDPDWARNHAMQIFPQDPQSEALFEAAWSTYIAFCGPFCGPYDNVLEILRPSYNLAVNRISEHYGDEEWFADLDQRLAEHLMAYYWCGKLLLDDPLLKTFWEKATDALRGHAITIIGRALAQTQGNISETILNRLKQLWEQRLAIAKEAPQRSDFEQEIAAFRSWFASGKFDDGWAISQLSQALELVRKVEPVDSVLKRLAETVETYPKESLQCLKMIAEGDRTGLRLYVNRDHVARMLELALNTSDTADEAKQVINYLGSRGFLEFRKLLKSSE